MADFNIAHKLTSRVEGGYVNHPNDPGGETIFGIARNYYPNWHGWIAVDKCKGFQDFPNNIKSLTISRINDGSLASGSPTAWEWLKTAADTFFKKEFWDTIRGDEIQDQDIANEIYDSSVNFGRSRAVKMAQEAVKIGFGADIDVDGKIGPKTIAALNSCTNKPWLYQLMNMIQGKQYLEIVEKQPKKAVFLRGWIQQRVSRGLLMQFVEFVNSQELQGMSEAMIDKFFAKRQ